MIQDRRTGCSVTGPHREDLAEKFKDANDPLRLIFVCEMWMTGFDAPSVSTV